MKLASFVMALLFLVSVSPVYALDLSYHDVEKVDTLLHGQKIAKSEAIFWFPSNDYVTDEEFNEKVNILNKEFEEKLAVEKDRTNDTIAIVTWGLVLLIALTMNGQDGNDGADGASGPPGPPGWCH